jgi:hypothetical protein
MSHIVSFRSLLSKKRKRKAAIFNYCSRKISREMTIGKVCEWWSFAMQEGLPEGITDITPEIPKNNARVSKKALLHFSAAMQPETRCTNGDSREKNKRFDAQFGTLGAL